MSGSGVWICLCFPVHIVTFDLCNNSGVVLLQKSWFLTVSIILASIGQLELARERPPFPMAT